MRPLFAYLCSNTELDLATAGLTIHVCVMSLAHTKEHEARKAVKRALPEDHYVGHRGVALKNVDEPRGGPKYGMIMIPQGIPSDGHLFKNNCLVVAFVVGKLLNEAAYLGERPVRKLLYDLKAMAQQPRASDKRKNAIGLKIWKEAQEALEAVCTPVAGAKTYHTLEDLCHKYNTQALVFSGALPAPKYVLPVSESLPRTDLPFIFLQEVESLNPSSKVKFHVHTVVRPEYLSPRRHLHKLNKSFLCF